MQIRINTKKIRKKLKNLPFSLAKHGFLFFSIIFFVVLGISWLFLNQKSLFLPSTPQEEAIIFQRNIYQQVIQKIKEREKIFLEAQEKQYPDIFQSELTQ